MKHLVILGAGTAGTMMAHKLRRALSADEWSISVIDQDDQHVYQPGLLLVPFGMYEADDLVRPRTTLLPDGVRLSHDGIAA
ncbi:MAG: tryptophan 7-halogenase, partial [Alphaproteobacteria bacterium]|nr:tryptophan 7-halogenase [Alphaproteobacteria bacterium]